MYFSYLLRNNFIIWNSDILLYIILQVFIIIIFFIYVDLMRKRCQLINVDVDVDVPIRRLSQYQTVVKPKPKQLPDYSWHSIGNCFIIIDLDISVFVVLFLFKPRIEKINTEARQKNREAMSIQNQAQGVRDDSDRLKASVQGDYQMLLCFNLISWCEKKTF